MEPAAADANHSDKEELGNDPGSGLVGALSSCREKWSGKRRTGGNCTRSPDSASPCDRNNLRITTLSMAAPQQRDPGSVLHDLAAIDARLARLCAAWASLPEHVILAILPLVNSAGVVEADRLQSLSQALPSSCTPSAGFRMSAAPKCVSSKGEGFSTRTLLEHDSPNG